MAVHALSNDSNNRSVTYRLLTGRSVTDAVIVKDRDFDAHVFACLLAVAAMEGGALGERLGLCGEDLTRPGRALVPACARPVRLACARNRQRGR